MSNPAPISFTRFNSIFTEYRARFERFAFFQIGNEEEAKDIVSKCFLSMWERREDIIEEQMLQYLFVSVRNACMDYRRSNIRHQKIYESILDRERGVMEYYSRAIESCDPSHIFTAEITDILRHTLSNLSPVQRQVFVRSRLEGKSYKEIAVELELSYKQVDKSMQKTMKVLRKALEEYIPAFIVFVNFLPELLRPFFSEI